MLGSIENIKKLLNDKSVYMFNDITYARTGETTTGSAEIKKVTIENLSIDDYVDGTGIQSDSQIITIGLDSITLDKNCTATSTAAIDITIYHYGDTDFENAILFYEDDVKYMNMYPLIGETYYIDLDATVTVDMTDAEILLIKGEEYLFAAYFLNGIGLKETSNHGALKDYKSNERSGIEQNGNLYLSDQYQIKASEYFRQAGINMTYKVRTF